MDHFNYLSFKCKGSLKINEIYYQHSTNLTTGMLWLLKTTQREKSMQTVCY